MFNMVANFKILKKPTLLTSFFKLKNKFDNTKRPQIDQQVKKCKKKNKQKQKTPKTQNPQITEKIHQWVFSLK